MSYEKVRPLALEWDAIQRARMQLNGMLRAFERMERVVPSYLDGDDPPGMLQVLEHQERAALKAVVAEMEGDEWLVRIRAFVESTLGLGPAVYCIVGLLPPLSGFANPAKLWKYLGLHVVFDQACSDNRATRVGGRAPKRPTCGPICKEKDCIHDRWSFHLKSYAIARVVGPIIRANGAARTDENGEPTGAYNPLSPYNPLLAARMQHTQTTHPEWATPKAPKLHYWKDAQRYVAKRVWRDIWRAAHGQLSGDTQLAIASASAIPLHGPNPPDTHPTPAVPILEVV